MALNKRQTFINPIHESNFLRHGFAVINVPNLELLNELEMIYRSQVHSNIDGLQLSLKEIETDVILYLHQQSIVLVQPLLNSILLNHNIIASGFINKLPGKNNTAGLHRDPSFTNENEHNTLLLWCPLTNTNIENGTIGIIPDSHKLFNGYKGMVYGKYDFSNEESQIIEHFGQDIELKKGEAIIFNTALLHYSKQNKTEHDRLVYTCFIIPNEAKPICYHFNSERQSVDEYFATETLLLNYYNHFVGKGELPFELIKREKFSPPEKIGFKKFVEMRRSKLGLWTRIKNKLNVAAPFLSEMVKRK